MASIAMAANRSLPRIVAVFSSAVLALATTSSAMPISAVDRGLAVLALPRRHPLNLVHATVRRTPVIAETLDAPHLQHLGKTTDQTCDNPHNVP